MDTYDSLKKKLDEQHQWPSKYMFKFILPKGREEELYAIIPQEVFTMKASKEGKYISYSATMVMNSAEEVLEIYKKTSVIKGLITL